MSNSKLFLLVNLMSKKLLISGLGGGMDVLNASILHFVAKSEKVSSTLGSVRPTNHDSIQNFEKFSEQGCIIDEKTVIDTNSKKIQRYGEPFISKYLQEKLIFFSRNGKEGKTDKKGLREAVEKSIEKFGFTHLFFVDGGGDSLVLQSSDCNQGSEVTDPFEGGDAVLMSALEGIPNVIQAVIAVGIDIDKTAFQNNLKVLKERRQYYGRVNIKTGEKDEYKLEDVLSFDQEYLKSYFSLAEEILVLKEEHLKEKPKRTESHTGTTTYHALKDNNTIVRTYVGWEPIQEDGSRGIKVDPDYCWMYFFDMTGIEKLKKELNKK